MYATTDFVIQAKDPLFDYCNTVCMAGNSLHNAALFRERQVLTMVNKPVDKLTENELEVLHEIEKCLPLMNKKRSMPQKGSTLLDYEFLDSLMKITNNPDYYNKVLPRQSAQLMLKTVEEEMLSFYNSCAEYKACPGKFTGKPNLPHYGKKGGCRTIKISNQDCVIYPVKDKPGYHELKLPKCKLRFNLGDLPIKGKLKETKIVPSHGVFVLSLTFECNEEVAPISEKPRRISILDLGVNNFAAMTNNIGAPCLLFKGGAIKSINQWYNKKMAKIMSEQTIGTTEKFKPTPESMKLGFDRANKISDFMHKVAKLIILWCLENKIDTLIVGENKGWKQNINLGDRNNQNFVSIPFSKFKFILKYLCEQNGIRYIAQEESYTSDASFLDNDYIPTYGVDDEKAVFSGKRRPTRYKGMYKKDGFRGLYVSKDGTIINADLNGSANIGRKAIPTMFIDGVMPNFNDVIIIKHPELVKRVENKAKQEAETRELIEGGKKAIISKSKKRRCKAKQLNSAIKGNPTGIVLCG